MSDCRSWLEERLEGDGRTVLLDGALGTELEAAGVACELPLWTSQALCEAPDLVARIHRDYARAGADILTAATFRTQERVLTRAGLGGRAEVLTRQAIELARGAASESPGPVWIAGSASTLEDCYRPDLAPPPAALEREHEAHAVHLANAGADLVLVETINNLAEGRAAALAAAATGLPFLVSFVCWQDACLLSGEPLARAIEAVAGAGPLAVLVNCLPPSAVAPCLPVLQASGLPFGVYPNLGAPMPERGRSEACTPGQLAVHAESWRRAGAAIIGGCCGTSPPHIEALRRLIDAGLPEPQSEE